MRRSQPEGRGLIIKRHRRLAAAMIAAGVSASARAADLTWTNAAGGLTWSTPGNWSPSGPPGAADNAVFAGAGTGTVQVDTPQTLNTLTVNAGGYSFWRGNGGTATLTLSRIVGNAANNG